MTHHILNVLSIHTASRMESNGIKGRIHVSESTATELIAMDCSSWLTPREDKVHAKGKGLMQTYWVLVPEESSTTRLSSSNGSSTHGGDSTRAEDDPESIIAMVSRSSSSNNNGGSTATGGAEHRSSSIKSMPTLNEE